MALFDRKKTLLDDDGQTSLEISVDGESSPDGSPIATARPRAPGEPPPTPARALTGPSTRIGESVTLEGTLKFQGAARVDGIVRGRVESAGSLLVGEDAEVAAEVHVGNLILHGAIEGDVTAREAVEIHEDGELRGDLRTPALTVHPGALFFGHCDMGGEE